MADTLKLPPPDEPMPVARRIVELHYLRGHDLTLRHWRGGWWRWQTSRWVEVEHRAIRADAYQVTENAVFPRMSKDGGIVWLPWNPNRHSISDLLEALAAITHLPQATAQPQWLCADALEGSIVSCANGLLHVDSRTLIPHTPEFFNVTSVPFDYDPNAPEPKRWLGFLNDLWPDDPDSVAALQQYMGYVVSGRLDLQKMLLLIGPTRAGKGAICRVLGALVGKNNVAGPTMSSLGTDFGLAPLIGKSLAVISDARLNSRNSLVVVERLLSISGEDTITVNIKYREQWNGKLPSRFVVLSNELPHFGDASAAIIGRFVVLMLTRSWLHKEDPDLEPELHAELPSILSWALDGLDRLTENGRFTRPDYAAQLEAELANLASPVGAFVRDCCDRDPLLAVPIDQLYQAWTVWADDNGLKPGSTQVFGRDLRAVVPTLRVTQPRDDGNRTRWYHGIALKGQH